MLRGLPTAAIGGLCALASLGSGCSLVLDFSGSLTDAGPVDATAYDAADTCLQDEPNETLETATPAARGVIRSSICPAGDRDVYGFTLDGATDLAVKLAFDGADGTRDLGMSLFDVATMEELTVAIGTDDDEEIANTAAIGNVLPVGSYAIAVTGADGVENAYVLELAIGEPLAADAGP